MWRDSVSGRVFVHRKCIWVDELCVCGRVGGVCARDWVVCAFVRDSVSARLFVHMKYVWEGGGMMWCVCAEGKVMCVCTRLGGVCCKGVCVLEGVWCVCWCQSSVRGVSG